MREDRGYWCMNEAEIGLPLDEQLFSILSHRLPAATATRAALTAERFSAPEALAAGIIEATASETDVVTHAIALAERYANLDRKILAHHKVLIHGEEAAFLGATARELESYRSFVARSTSRHDEGNATPATPALISSPQTKGVRPYAMAVRDRDV